MNIPPILAFETLNPQRRPGSVTLVMSDAWMRRIVDEYQALRRSPRGRG